MIRTKIVATMGPACSSVDVLVSMLEAGVDVCRLNFSHGTHEEHGKMLLKIRQAAERLGQAVAVLGDLCGPKIRLGKIVDKDGTGGMPINVGDTLRFVRQQIVGENGRVSTIFPRFVDDVQVGDRILIEDGLLKFVCTEKSADELLASCLAGGILKSSKGINLPNTNVNVPSITEKDWEDVDWAVENGLDYLALSFVRRPADLMQLREHMKNSRCDLQLIAKIEKAEAITEIDAIIDASDGLMIARGDLGVEMDAAQVPIIQKDLIQRCRSAGKPVIVATQMLQSMIEASSPTRAEVSDVANAIFDGTDAIMLSGETSVGKFPVGTVHTMSHIAEVTEQYLINTAMDRDAATTIRAHTMHLSAALSKGVWAMVHDLKPKLIVVWSQTGATARIFSKARFPVPVLALSTDHRVLRQMALHFGVMPQELQMPDSTQQLIDWTDRMVRAFKYGEEGDRIVIVAGTSLGIAETIDGIIIHTVGQPATSPQPIKLETIA